MKIEGKPKTRLLPGASITAARALVSSIKLARARADVVRYAAVVVAREREEEDFPQLCTYTALISAVQTTVFITSI